MKAACVVVGVAAALLAAAPARAADRATTPWAAAERVHEALFSAQEDLIAGVPGEAAGDVGRARAAYRGALRRGLRSAAPEQDRAMRAALAGAARAARAHDEPALASARGAARAAALGGAFAVTLAAAGRGDAATARTWLLLRDFRTATRFTRPGADATAAVDRLARRKAAPSAVRLAIAKDLLDAYQARLRELLKDLDTAGERGFGTRAAETAAQAAGYWRILAPRYREDRGPAATAAAARAFAGLRASAATATAAASPSRAPRSKRALDGFTAAPFTAAESARRAQQLLRFVALVPVEYGRGVKDGRVTLDFEVQEAIAFQTASGAAFDDLRDQLAKRDAARTAALAVALDRLGAAVAEAGQRKTGIASHDVGRAAGRRDRAGPQGGHARRLGEADRRFRLRPDRADARPHGGGGRRRPAPPGRAGAARGLRVLRVRPRAAAEVDRPGPRHRHRRADLVRRQGRARPGRADLQGRPAARPARRRAWRSTTSSTTRAARSATARAARRSSPTRRSSCSARAWRRC